MSMKNKRGLLWKKNRKIFKGCFIKLFMDEWSKWIGKKVFIETNSKRRYSGVVQDYVNNILTLLDRNNKIIGIAVFAISIIQEEE